MKLRERLRAAGLTPDEVEDVVPDAPVDPTEAELEALVDRALERRIATERQLDRAESALFPIAAAWGLYGVLSVALAALPGAVAALNGLIGGYAIIDAQWHHDENAPAAAAVFGILASMSGFVALVPLLVGVACLAVALGLARRWPSARWLGIAYALVLAVGCFPVGLLLAIPTVVWLVRPEMDRLFAPP